MAWKTHNVMKPGYLDRRKKLAEDTRCPQCGRKGALKYHDTTSLNTLDIYALFKNADGVGIECLG